MTEIVVQNGEYKIYAGFPAMIAIEFYYAIHHVGDIMLFLWLLSLDTAIV